MPIFDVDVDDICTDEDLDEFLGGQVHSGPMNLQPDAWQDAKPARQYALDRVLEALRRRTPPIDYGQLSFPKELKLAVLYGAAEHLYALSKTTNIEGDVYEGHRRMWEQKFNEEISGLVLTLASGQRVSGGSFGVFRR